MNSNNGITTVFNSNNTELIEEMYSRFLENPSGLNEDWIRLFNSLEEDRPNGSHALELPETGKERGLQKLKDAYRRQGHLAARLDPLGMRIEIRELLEMSQYNLLPSDMEREFDSGIPALGRAKLGTIIDWMERTYCSSIGAEHFYIGNNEERAWLQNRLEKSAMSEELDAWVRLRLFEKIFQAETFEKFIARKYVGKKRFSLEGGETLIAVLDTIVEEAGQHDMKGLVLAMAHRGRLNVLVNVMEKPAGLIFAEFDENFNPESADYADVKYHLGYSNKKMTRWGREVSLSLMFNPSHLEAVNPVAAGSVRARQKIFKDTERNRYMPVIIHGDAAFPGQGVVSETLNMMNLKGYTVGGTFHIIVNNQIGFTTLPDESRSTRYSTDLAKGFQIPIFHVNADDPEAVYRTVKLCLDYRQKFHKDILLDLVCYRRLGHNENDEPAFTQPAMYEIIKSLPTTASIYENRLLSQPDIAPEQLDYIKNGTLAGIENSFQKARESNTRMAVDTMKGRWSGLSDRPLDTEPETKLLAQQMERVVSALTSVPENFSPHPRLLKFVEARRKMFDDKASIDWGFAEALAFGSILENGFDIRLSGQDSQRGTFSHRHAVMIDVRNGAKWIPLNNISDKQGNFEVRNSPLSEFSVLGFDYGYSMTDPNTLVIWEAQFGDFVNSAQIIIDQFISSSEIKWRRMSGLVMLLPHGYEGQGPEHSSARLERFLQLCSGDNMQVCNCTTPAQYFHLLRRQMLRNYRKPLIIMSPKSLLRLQEAGSSMSDIAMGIFREVIFDTVDESRVKRIVFCSGKVYYDIVKQRNEEKNDSTAILRIEQLYPFPESQIEEALQKYNHAEEFFWLQEEPENQGALGYIASRLQEFLPAGATLKISARRASPSPAAGQFKLHSREQQEIVNACLK